MGGWRGSAKSVGTVAAYGCFTTVAGGASPGDAACAYRCCVRWRARDTNASNLVVVRVRRNAIPLGAACGNPPPNSNPTIIFASHLAELARKCRSRHISGAKVARTYPSRHFFAGRNRPKRPIIADVGIFRPADRDSTPNSAAQLRCGPSAKIRGTRPSRQCIVPWRDTVRRPDAVRARNSAII